MAMPVVDVSGSERENSTLFASTGIVVVVRLCSGFGKPAAESKTATYSFEVLFLRPVTCTKMSQVASKSMPAAAWLSSLCMISERWLMAIS